MGFLPVPITLQSLFGKVRKIGPINAQFITTSESTSDILTITKQPVQQGASITDHAYKEPTVFSMAVHFKDNPGSLGSLATALNPFGGGAATGLAKIYQDLLDLQNSRVPFDVITPKRIYRNVLIASLGNTTDKVTENILAISFTFQEIIIVSVVTTQVPRAAQRLVGATGATQNAGKKSALVSLKEGIGGLFR